MKKTHNYTNFIFYLLILYCAQPSIILCAPAAANSLFTPMMPTTSINETAIDAIYGKSGLNLPQDDIIQIKQTYGYLEVIVKSHKIATNPALTQIKESLKNLSLSKKNSSSLSQDICNSKEWKSVVITNAEIESSDVWQLYLKSSIVDHYENQRDFIETISMIQDQMFPYLANIELNFYNNDFIQLRTFAELLRIKKMLQDNTLQQYVHACIDWKDKDQATMNSNIAAFKLTDFYIRTHDKTVWTPATAQAMASQHPLQEYVMTYFMLTTIQSSVQDKFNQKNLLSFLTTASSPKLAPNFFCYQPTDLICLDDILALQTILNKKNNPTPPTPGTELQSFNISDLVDMSKTGIQPANNVQGFQTGSKESDNVIIQKSKNPFTKMGKDFNKTMKSAGKGITDAANATGKGIEQAANITAKSITDTAVATGQGLEQTTNALGNDLDVKDIGSALVSTGNALGHAAQGVGYGLTGSSKAISEFNRSGKDFNKAIKTLSSMAFIGTMTHGVEGVALGAAGFGATLIGDLVYAQTGNKSIKDWGSKESKKAMDDLQTAGKDLNTVIDSTAKALEDGIVAPVALVAGNAVGFILQDQKIGQDMTLVMNQVCDSAINVGSAGFTSMNNLLNTQLVALYKVSESGVEMIVDAVMVAYGGVTGQTAVTNRSAAITTATTKGLVKNMAQAATSTLSCAITSAMNMIMSCAAVMAAVENSMTTITFDMVREITFLGSGLGELMGAPVSATQERNKISAKMEKHRGTINIVMSVVVMVAVTVLTCGAAAPEAEAILSAEIGGQAATEAATQTAITATEQATEQAARIAATELSTTTATAAESSAAAITEETTTVATSTGQASATAAEGSSTTAEVAVRSSTEAITQATEEVATKETSFLAAYGADIMGQAINLVFSVFSVISGDNQDEAAIKMLAQEKASIMNLWQFIENNKVVMTQSQNLYLDELHKKHEAAIENQNFGLNYYTNYLNSSINNIQNQISHALSEQYIELLTPDVNESRIADIGSTWGLTTPFVYLYPSQGFLTTTLGRPNFPYAQEIAQAPLIAQDKGTDATKNALDNNTKQTSKSWFNQRAVANVNQATDAPLNVEMQFKIIYNLTSDFYVGLYLGGKYYDYNSPEYLADIQNNGGIHLDDAHLAKMFVVKRESNEKIPSIGVYENEGKEWIVNKTLDEKLFTNSSTYHMSATLHKNQLTVAFWPLDKPSEKWSSTVVITPCDQRTFGVIFSGAAIEWNVIKPVMPIVTNGKVRTGISNPPEADRERAAKKLWTTLKNPQFGAMKLETLGKKYLLQGQYLYTTQDTKLTDKDNKVISDTVAFAIYNSGIVSNIGASPIVTDTSPSTKAQQPNAIVSMISGNIYDSKGIVIDTKQDPWPLFMKNNGPFDQALIDSITAAQKNVPQKSAPVAATPSKTITTSSGTISLSNIAVNSAPSTGGFQFGLSNQVPITKAPAQSFDQRQAKATDGAEVQVGGLTGAGAATISMSNTSMGAKGFSL